MDCSVIGCLEPAAELGWCPRHFDRLGVPLTDAERFARFVRVDPETGCHVWTGSTSRIGYGYFRIAGRARLAHRVAWRLAFGSLPDELDHVCRRRNCVNVAHLEAVSRSENMRRAYAAVPRKGSPRSTGFCRKGHRLTPVPAGRLVCHPCRSSAQRTRRAAAREGG